MTQMKDMAEMIKKLSFVLFSTFIFSSTVQAAANLEITKRLTWDVVGLDSNKLTSGPDTFPVGYRICNTGDTTATNVESTFSWLTPNPYINLASDSPSIKFIGDMAAGACYDAYYNVTVTRDTLAYDTSRQYQVIFTADNAAQVQTPIDASNYNEIYVEHLISQSRNQVSSILGPNDVFVGEVYTFVLNAKTAPGGYEQLETFLTFSGKLFEIISATGTYTADDAGLSPNDAVYADACGWVHDPENPNYFTNSTNTACTGVGKAGGTIEITYQIRVLDAGIDNVKAMIYDFSGSSFHYNADYGSIVKTITSIFPPADISIEKSIDKNASAVGDTVVFTLKAINSDIYNSYDTNVTDILPTGYTYVGSSASVGSYDSISGLWQIGVLASGSIEELNITATVNASGEYNNTATIAGAGEDSNLTNNISSANTNVSTLTGHLYIDINGNGIQESSEPNLENVDVLVTDADGTTQVFTTGIDGNFTATRLQVGEAIVDIDNNDSDFPAGAVQTEGSDPTTVTIASGNNSEENNGYQLWADISVVKTLDSAGPFVPGQTITYTIIVSNEGPAIATDINVTDIPTNLNITNTSSTNCATLPCIIPSLPIGGSEVITVTAVII